MRLVCINDAAADLVVTAGGLPVRAVPIRPQCIPYPECTTDRVALCACNPQVLMGASRTHAKRADVQRAFVGALWELGICCAPSNSAFL